MKTLFTTAMVIAIVVFFIVPSKTFAGTPSHKKLAGANDTLVVYASGLSLDQLINSDTAAGMQAHAAYKLVSLDTSYLYLAPITVVSNFTVIGVLGPNGRPPCIQPGVLSDGSIPAVLFTLNGQGTIGVFKNLYITDLATNNSFTGTKDILISADQIKLYVDNVIFDENHYEVIAFSGLSEDFFITNCKFRNGVDPTNWFGSSLLACDYPTNNPADSIVMDYNTFLCINSRAVTTGNQGPVNYFEFCHNSYIYNVTEDLRMFTVSKGKFDNNIFYSLYAGAQPVSEYPAWFEPFSPETNSLIDFDTLTLSMDSTYDPADVSSSNLRMLAEAKRNIEVKNNVYFWGQKLTSFWTAWDDTAHGADSLITAPWMNHRTTNMFTDKTHWPNLVQSGNQNTDPEFGNDIIDVADNSGNTAGVVGLTKYVTEIRTGTASTDVWGYNPNVVSGNNWIPAWPLPEQITGGLKYSAPLLAPDGNPYGDPYWFTLSTTPKNLSVISTGDTYTFSPSPSSNYPDSKKTKLTDGIFASTAYYADPAWVGFTSTDTLNVVIDLKSVMPVQQFMGEYLLDPQPAINLPTQVSVSISTDGTIFTNVGILSDNSTNDSTSSIHKYYYTLPNTINARYVKFSTLAQAGAWVFVDEYEVLAPVTTGIKKQTSSVPTNFNLSQNYPNPFNPSTNINFSLEKPSNVTLSVYNVLGQKVATLVNSFMQAGSYTYQFDASKLASGIYIYRIETGNFVSAKKMILLK
jgi:hypothetical protein